MKALIINFLSFSLFLIPGKPLHAAFEQKEQHPKVNADSPFYQVIISEIMADPDPQVLLPDAEYIEIYNRGPVSIDLTGWNLIIGSHNKVFPDVSIEPGEYRIVCEAGKDNLFTKHGRTIAISNMPSILNTGQVLSIKTNSGEIIHSVTFSDRWFKSKDKARGGWSLEIIDPENPCGGTENWSESADLRGGSPGTINSVYAHNPDNKPPKLLRATLPSDSSVLLHFSEPLAVATITAPSAFSVNHGLLHPGSIIPVEPDITKVILTYPVLFRPEFRYTITVLNTLEDCAGNALTTNSLVDFAVSQSPLTGDLVINELLFDVPDSISEFIEIFNRSDKVLDLSAVAVSIAECATGIIKRTVTFENYPFLLFPRSYLVITQNARKLPVNKIAPNLSGMIEHPGLFTFPDMEGMVVLMDTLGQTIDELQYNSSMHAEFLINTTGVSLERINPDYSSSDPNNWYSASFATGYSSPGFQNSQFSLHEDNWGEISVTPEIFSPDNDGVDDYVSLHLQVHEPGWVATISVFDAGGKKIKNLVNRNVLGTDEYITWDGKRADEQPAVIGIYIMFAELYSPKGTTKNFKKVITLVRRL